MFSHEAWGKKVNEYVISVTEMKPESFLALWDDSRQMAKNIAQKSAKGQLTSSAAQAQAQPAKPLGPRTLLKEGHPATQA